MIAVTGFAGEKVAVLGLGRSGLVAATALQQGGARLLAWDDAAEKRDTAAAAGIPIVDLGAADLDGVRTLVLSPGIPHTHPSPHPLVPRLRAAGAEIIGDIELLARSRREARYVGVTGTNGKSTTTALIAHMLTTAGQRMAVGGNLGTPALSLAPLDAGGIYVLEMSSFQLELTPSLTFDVAVLINVTPDHLDRHGGMAGYIAAKRRIFDRQKAPQAAVVGVDDEICSGIAGTLARAGHQVVVPISAESAVPGGVHAETGWLADDTGPRTRRVLDLREVPRLPGRHNWQNAAAAYAVARRLDVPSEAAVEGIESFPGLAHRQELIETVDGIRYVNDSKATNADAAAKALGCYDAIYWIAGGVPKAGGIEPLRPFFGRLRHAFLIGAASEAFARTLEGAVPWSRSGDLAAALAAARRHALAERPAGAVVLLSPACASYDQFANFEARGDAFRRLVEALPGARS